MMDRYGNSTQQIEVNLVLWVGATSQAWSSLELSHD